MSKSSKRKRGRPPIPDGYGDEATFFSVRLNGLQTEAMRLLVVRANSDSTALARLGRPVTPQDVLRRLIVEKAFK